jgi:voltage-gated sodium channel
MRERLAAIVATRAWETAIAALILVNAVTLGLETADATVAAARPFLHALDRAILAVFVVEIGVRLYVKRLAFLRDPWSVFDFAIVGVALMPASGPFDILRSLRILRAMRLISVVPSLRRVVSGLIDALPGMGSILLLLTIVFYVFAVMATELFGAAFPDRFGTLGRSAYTLFQVMTLEGWSDGVARPVMEVSPFAWLFFIPFILMTSFVVLNLFIGVIVSAMQEQVGAAAEQHEIKEEGLAMHEELRALRRELAELRTLMERRLAA